MRDPLIGGERRSNLLLVKRKFDLRLLLIIISRLLRIPITIGSASLVFLAMTN